MSEDFNFLSCPFCDGLPILEIKKLSGYKMNFYRIKCIDCEGSSAWYHRAGDAQEYWNERIDKDE